MSTAAESPTPIGPESVLEELLGLHNLALHELKSKAGAAAISIADYDRGSVEAALRRARLDQLSSRDLHAVACSLGLDVSNAVDRWDATANINDAIGRRVTGNASSIAPDRLQPLVTPPRSIASDFPQPPRIRPARKSSKRAPARLSEKSTSLDDPVQQVFEFKVGDRALRKNEACIVIAVDELSGSCTVQMESDGRTIDTLPAYLKQRNAQGDDTTCSRCYPSQAHDEESCPICCRPVLGENCVPCCQRCEESRWLHRRCLLGLVCRSRCPAGHGLTETQFNGSITCGCCERTLNVHGFLWQCCDCNWRICRSCIAESLDPEALCPTCRAPLPMVQGCQPNEDSSSKFDKRQLDPLFCQRH